MYMDCSKKLRILVVGDAQIHRLLMTSDIGMVNPFFDVEEASGVQGAIAKLSGQRFDAVVCDWKMASGNGDELVKWMRVRPHYRRVPFIMISGNTATEDIIRAFVEFSVDGYIAKPFSAEELYRKIRAAIGKRNGP